MGQLYRKGVWTVATNRARVMQVTSTSCLAAAGGSQRPQSPRTRTLPWPAQTATSIFLEFAFNEKAR